MIPSAEQKRPAANGKSKETIVGLTPSKEEAFALKLRVSVAHTPVSNEGTTIISCLWPCAPPTTTSPRPSEFTTVTDGALSPTFTSFPNNSTSVPLNFVVAVLAPYFNLIYFNKKNIYPE